MIPSGRAFFKMSGSGNDFVMVDARTDAPGWLAEPQTVQRVCARATGIGADGIVFLEPSDVAAVKLNYLNADGSPADLCGNATLCTTRLAVELGIADPSGFGIETPSGIVRARCGGRHQCCVRRTTQVRATNADKRCDHSDIRRRGRYGTAARGDEPIDLRGRFSVARKRSA